MLKKQKLSYNCIAHIVVIQIKIVVSGPLQSGKSSYIKALDDNALNVETKGKDEKHYTVGMDLGCVKLNGFDCYLFGTPGLLRFWVMRNIGRLLD